MEVYPYLRRRIAYMRDGYSAGQRERISLYAWLKVNEAVWRKESVRIKLGRRNYEWLVGLVAYGDKRDWMKQFIEQEVVRRGRGRG